MDVSPDRIAGDSAQEIAESVRGLIDSGELAPGDALPPYRRLAEHLGVNRNTTIAAYRQLAVAGAVETRGRGGTIVLGPHLGTEEGFLLGTTLRDVGSGNPDAALLPNPADVSLPAAPPRLYGETPIDPALAAWATEWIRADRARPFSLSVTSGAVDAVERLLAGALAVGDAVALEDPCYLTSINTTRVAGYRTIPVPVDADGMTPDGLRAALEQGARAVVCTPRAHNPTGVSVSPERAAELRATLEGYPNVLVVEDDHFSLLSTSTPVSIVPPEHRRWALVRSVSKFLGPDLRLALVATDDDTARRLALRTGSGATWVSHLLQRTVHALVSDASVLARVRQARAHYAKRNLAFVERLRLVGVPTASRDGLNVWVDVATDATEVADGLADRGWLVREGGMFTLGDEASTRLRFTVHDLTDAEQETLVEDLIAAREAAANGLSPSAGTTHRSPDVHESGTRGEDAP
ncbi:aminotransferase class I/II-fold pyridoxal phosphate-dependent enzyme [Pseudoclavibacter chungangensis]|uniref:Aminotransferase class I/II-fold pyridoxal phosphate-dependent enzyme n=1 Tax=Pseudoclavibacter chungangensis TaxID=587635 RepID=A0A7J5BP78_9MICO|nr:aminotransferase class I/II-fold pyridoxal phosphate-dependent enzyme [Pseudoclavibacter chungangensis]KAB1652308.1 aminotransferase class I/II-fold pyridoxal phosphate-dependent enzyme [Pseudoclavibacter chungangensis]NYJ66909.1 DNA-binding transcriptional MocR family regulator [Pseudoclavibacter chungangensis]